MSQNTQKHITMISLYLCYSLIFSADTFISLEEPHLGKSSWIIAL